MDDKCHCGGELIERRITHFLEVDGTRYLFENVPVLVCSQCGEKYFRPDVHDMIVHSIHDGAVPDRFEPVAVIDLESLVGP
ncbi:MAG: YgiT-type zinc finger protein [Chloroflexi bacterium]|nr:YgiT-type zinc finger protein [Chloroflexota bacterium]